MQDTNPDHVSIPELAARAGTTVLCEGNLPVELDDTDHVWFVEQGTVDLFMLESKAGVEQAAPQHILRLDAGRLLPSVASDAGNDEDGSTTLRLVGKGLPGTTLKRLPVASLSEIRAAEYAQQIDAWLMSMMETLARFVIRFPRPTALVEVDTTTNLEPCTLGVRRGVVWVTGLSSGSSVFMDMVDVADLADDEMSAAIPLTKTNWLAIFDNTTVEAKASEALVREGNMFEMLANFHKLAFRLERLNRQLAVVDDANLERDRAMSRRVAENVARKRLYNLYDHPLVTEEEGREEVLAAALEIIGNSQGIEFTIPVRVTSSSSPVELADILDASGVRARRVRLDSLSKWWRGDHAELLAFRTEDNQPVALVPGFFGRYRQIDPITERSIPVTKEVAASLKNDAWMFYRPLPTGNIEPSDLLQLALHGSGTDLARLVVTGFISAALTLVPALMLGLVANHVLGGGNSDALYMVAVTLAAVGLLAAMLQQLQDTAMNRIEGRSTTRLEAAVWDRFMRLPSSVLNRRPRGDLAMSGMTFQSIRDGLLGVVANSLLAVVFMLPAFGIVFFYDAVLGMITLGFSVVSVALTAYIGLRQISPYGMMMRAIRRVAGVLFEIVGGIAKIRVEHAEGSAFAMWANEYREQKRSELELSKYEGYARAFGDALPYLAAAVLLFAVVTVGDRQAPVGEFLIIYSIFLVFQHTVARFGQSFGTVVAMLPTLQQVRPLLSAVPEPDSAGDFVESLSGEILFDRVSFRYESNGPLILDDVTIHARPGEFIAIAGESGAGKSTLFRLALGLEQPTGGAVYYDGRDLRQLNAKQLRRHVGAVPQAVRLHPQDIWDNIVAHRDEPTTDEVWHQARAASIEDEIKAMPMGLMTMVGASGSVLSGGESQRITIARSLLGNPRIMLFDEATNWLDNESQAIVMQNLSRLSSTRIVIAHRLSTLQQADRIMVMQAGKIVQRGSFDELMEVEGVFKELVKRQIA